MQRQSSTSHTRFENRQVCPGRESEPDTLYCGAEPAALFVSRDSGDTWSLVRGLFDHPHRPRWVPGNGGLALTTILLDPSNDQRMYVAISAGGVYRTDDGGATWLARNRGIRVTFQPNKEPEFGQCVHKMVLHPARPERIFLQHHWGLYRSEDHADCWQSISNGLPSDFGFAMVMHPRDPDCVYILPVESDEFRCTPDGRLRVYRTRDAGACWEPLTRGLPQKGAYETVLRDAMCTDGLGRGQELEAGSWRLAAHRLRESCSCWRAAYPANVKTGATRVPYSSKDEKERFQDTQASAALRWPSCFIFPDLCAFFPAACGK